MLALCEQPKESHICVHLHTGSLLKHENSEDNIKMTNIFFKAIHTVQQIVMFLTVKCSSHQKCPKGTEFCNHGYILYHEHLFIFEETYSSIRDPSNAAEYRQN